jgi:hypothetical protein
VLEVDAKELLDREDRQGRVEGDDRREPGLEQPVAGTLRPLGGPEEPGLPEQRQDEDDSDAHRLVALGRPPGVRADDEQYAEPDKDLDRA